MTAIMLPADWSYEGEDRSVGIFGESFYHCSDDEATVEETGTETIGQGHNRLLVTSITLTCPGCGATAQIARSDYIGPEEDEDGDH